MAQLKGLDGTNTASDVDWRESVAWAEFPKNKETYKYRLFPTLFVYAMHWVNTNPGDPTKGKVYPRICTNFDCEKETASLKRGCLCCEDKRISKIQKMYLMDGINREMQESGVKQPIKGFQFPAYAVQQIKDHKKFNKGVHITDPRVGRDVYVSYDKNSTKQKWLIQLDPNNSAATPFTEKEAKYELHDYAGIFPDFSDESLLASYNASTYESLKRQGYLDTDTEEEDTPPPNMQKLDRSRVVMETEATPPPANVTKLSVLHNERDAAKLMVGETPAGEKCPFYDGEHRFGNFQGDAICGKCNVKRSCIASGGD